MNYLYVQQYFAEPVIGSPAGSWQTLHAEGFDGSTCPDVVLDIADLGEEIYRLVVIDPSGTVLDTTESQDLRADRGDE